ncbi:MAG TPA: type II toxin-antitoxin system PemK/MazF family toxin [Pirellulales bacterium]|nr:type II toxin-antitoxin system PemK/MazF family toxin [Pirellulales bacterium]
MSVQRGDVVLVDYPFADATGSKVRPALVVQSDYNNARIANTVVVMITRRKHMAASEPTQVLLDPLSPDGQSTGLLTLSAIACENLFTVNQRRIIRTPGKLSDALMLKVDDSLKTALDLS